MLKNKKKKEFVADSTRIHVLEEDASQVSSEFNITRITEIQGQWPTGSETLLRKGRVYVREGTLNKMCRKGLKPRHFFLFNDLLVYGSIITKGKYTDQHVLALADLSITDLDETAFQLNHKRKSFQVYATSLADKAAWLASLRKYIQAAAQRNPDEAISNSRAVWVPDSQVKICMVCGEFEFSLLKRRHHCRNCGKVVCGPCSSFQAVLNKGKLERVCRDCYEEIEQKPTTRERPKPKEKHPKHHEEEEGDSEDSSDDSDSDSDDSGDERSSPEKSVMSFISGGGHAETKKPTPTPRKESSGSNTSTSTPTTAAPTPTPAPRRQASSPTFDESKKRISAVPPRPSVPPSVGDEPVVVMRKKPTTEASPSPAPTPAQDAPKKVPPPRPASVAPDKLPVRPPPPAGDRTSVLSPKNSDLSLGSKLVTPATPATPTPAPAPTTMPRQDEDSSSNTPSEGSNASAASKKKRRTFKTAGTQDEGSAIKEEEADKPDDAPPAPKPESPASPHPTPARRMTAPRQPQPQPLPPSSEPEEVASPDHIDASPLDDDPEVIAARQRRAEREARRKERQKDMSGDAPLESSELPEPAAEHDEQGDVGSTQSSNPKPKRRQLKS